MFVLFLDRAHFTDISSFSESHSLSLFQKSPMEFILHNRRLLSRVYPAGVRVNSSNYDPIPHWSSGCQLVALNYQTYDRGTQLNTALFQDNGGCGYVLKPVQLRYPDTIMNQSTSTPTTTTTQIITIKIISCQQLPKPKSNTRGEIIDPYVEIIVNGGTFISPSSIQNSLPVSSPVNSSSTNTPTNPTTTTTTTNTSTTNSGGGLPKLSNSLSSLSISSITLSNNNTTTNNNNTNNTNNINNNGSSIPSTPDITSPHIYNKYRTKTIMDNGFNPIWNETAQFLITDSDLCFTKFVIYDEDVAARNDFIAMSVIRLNNMQEGIIINLVYFIFFFFFVFLLDHVHSYLSNYLFIIYIGYRQVQLMDWKGDPLQNSRLFIYFSRQYVDLASSKTLTT